VSIAFYRLIDEIFDSNIDGLSVYLQCW